MTPPLLEAAQLGKDYGAVRAVDALDLTIDPGQIFGLLGPNGAGKTTAISMMCGVVTPTRGRAQVAGHDVVREPFAARAAVGLVPQDLALYEELDAHQNLAFFGALYRLRGAELASRIDWALDVAGLADRSREPVARFSGGMQRRLNLAAGLLHRPRLLILDEPTVGVDPQSRNHIFKTIRALVADHGMTVLYTSHYMEEVELLCHRVAIMDAGKLVACDTVRALLERHGGGTFELELSGADPDVVARAVEATGAQVLGIRARTGSLEDVFLALTGHSLRDEEAP